MLLVHLFVLVLFIIAITSVWEESFLLYASRAFVCFSPVYHCSHLGLGRERSSICFSCICLFLSCLSLQSPRFGKRAFFYMLLVYLFSLVLFIIAITSVWEERIRLYVIRTFVCLSLVYYYNHLDSGRKSWSICFSCVCLFLIIYASLSIFFSLLLGVIWLVSDCDNIFPWKCHSTFSILCIKGNCT